MKQSSYRHVPHNPDCTCSVCWSKTEMAKPARCLFTPCDQCRPAFVQRIRILKVGKVSGIWTPLISQWQVIPAYTCAKHTPSQRPQPFWRVVENIGKPVPFVPIHEPFELVG
ncbi:lysogeny maintenance protein PflM [Pseudomonas sp. TTU2014-080ASC]|uniref:lysogeny maintenance protein PflM n=1 Tax=Pseudomonas sp. TTU2014-080ASC TaxID=1729724 RepID=UPI0009EACF05|nr:DUF5447 family protein [Pseudomonas sp. TTU2014-080ASC]